MKKFRMRLWLVKRLLDSLVLSDMCEYSELDAISEGVAHLHSAIENDCPGKRVAETPLVPIVAPDPELVKRMREIISRGTCDGPEIPCNCWRSETCDNPPLYWKCSQDVESAKRWLRKHGIKEEA